MANERRHAPLGHALISVGGAALLATPVIVAVAPKNAHFSLGSALALLVMAVGGACVVIGLSLHFGWPHKAGSPLSETAEVREGKRLLASIQPHSVAAERATETARPHAASLVTDEERHRWRQQAFRFSRWAHDQAFGTLQLPSEREPDVQAGKLREIATGTEAAAQKAAATRRQVHLRVLIAEGQGYERELIKHREAHAAVAPGNMIATLLAGQVPDALAEKVLEWGTRVRPVVVESDLPATEIASLAFYPSVNPCSRNRA